MNDQLIKNNFLILKNIIPKDFAISIGSEFKTDCEKANFAGDEQARNSHSVYNYKRALEILCDLNNEVSNTIGEPVLPTYTYARIYKNGSVLQKHKDRPACEVSLTLHLDGDETWPIWVENAHGKRNCVYLEPGDAMLYLGCVAPHWRDAYDGEWYAQFFLHYVRSNGPCREYYFDKEKDQRGETEIVDALLDEILNQKPFPNRLINKYVDGLVYSRDDLENSNFNSTNSLNSETEMTLETNSNILDILAKKREKLKAKKDPIVIEKEPESTTMITNVDSAFVRFDNEKVFNKSEFNTLDHYIKRYEGAVSDKLCDAILNEYVTTDLWNNALTGSGLDQNARNCDVIGISHREILNQNYDYRMKLDAEIYESVHEVLNDYDENFGGSEGLSIEKDTGYELLRYREGQFYVQHTDHFAQNPRILSCTICLNDDYEGGEFGFFDRKIKMKLKKGDILMFPSSFMYPHEVLPVTKGNRYNIITWLV